MSDTIKENSNDVEAHKKWSASVEQGRKVLLEELRQAVKTALSSILNDLQVEKYCDTTGWTEEQKTHAKGVMQFTAQPDVALAFLAGVFYTLAREPELPPLEVEGLVQLCLNNMAGGIQTGLREAVESGDGKAIAHVDTVLKYVKPFGGVFEQITVEPDKEVVPEAEAQE